MHVRIRMLLVGALAASALAATVTSASANHFSVSERSWRHVWNPIIFAGLSGEFMIRCNLTVEGSFHAATSQKVAGALSGFATRATLSVCTGGAATILQETLPWHVVYESFRGVLPRITGVTDTLVGTGFRIEPGMGIICLARMTVEHPGRSTINLEASGAAMSITADDSAQIPLTGVLCPMLGEFSGTGRITRLGSTAFITVRLI